MCKCAKVTLVCRVALQFLQLIEDGRDSYEFR
jgi:hypothetical protein